MVKLFPHQREALERLCSGSILCGGVGTGKSLTALAYYFEKECGGRCEADGYLPMRHPKDLYIITTARKRDTGEWALECGKFLLAEKHNAYPTKLVIDSWNNIGKYVGAKDSFFIFDEQRVVGSGAWVRSFLKITKSNRWILLTATPGDTWMDYVPVFIANGYFKNRTEFIRKHVQYNHFISKYPKIDRYVNCGPLVAMRKKLVVRMDYRKKTVPHHLDIPCTYDRAKFKETITTRWNPYKEEPIQDAGGLCYVLRRVCNEDPSRVQAVLDIWKERRRAIVFYNFDYELEALRAGAKSMDIPCTEWNGHKHEAIPDTKTWLYLVQYTAGAEGWNCTSSDTIIFFSQNYSYKTMVQSAGRVDRLNTPYTDLWYYHLRSSSPIDLAISRALRDKKDFNENAFVSSKKHAL